MGVCYLCFRQCEIGEGKTGACGARTCKDGRIVPKNYGLISSIALDPIEKKPLARFLPGSMILSVGSYGCNLRCPFCQNHEISWSEESFSAIKHYCGLKTGDNRSEAEPDLYDTAGDNVWITPEELADLAERYKDHGNIGIAYTYNEPLICYEFIRDTARLVHEKGMKNVLVTNGSAVVPVLEEIAPFIDAMNIDLKGFSDRFYENVLGGNRHMVMKFIAYAVTLCHVEITTLIIPGENDSEEEMRELSAWIADLKKDGIRIGEGIPLHISRFFPRFKMTDRPPTDVEKIYRLADIARENLKFVYTGNC